MGNLSERASIVADKTMPAAKTPFQQKSERNFFARMPGDSTAAPLTVNRIPARAGISDFSTQMPRERVPFFSRSLHQFPNWQALSIRLRPLLDAKAVVDFLHSANQPGQS